MTDVKGTTCWPWTYYSHCTTTKSMLWQNSTSVQASVFDGDSGSPAFTGNPGTGGPYAAMGILVAGSIPAGQDPRAQCPTCVFYFARWDNIEQRLGMGILDPTTNLTRLPTLSVAISGTSNMSAGNNCTFSASASGGSAPYAFSWSWQAVNGASAGGYSPSNGTFQLIAQNNSGQVNLTAGATDPNGVHGTATKVITFGSGSCYG